MSDFVSENKDAARHQLWVHLYLSEKTNGSPTHAKQIADQAVEDFDTKFSTARSDTNIVNDT